MRMPTPAAPALFAGRRAATALAAALVLALAACGGSKEDEDDQPASRAEAAHFLAQASFGPTEAEIDRVMKLGFRGWIDDQLARPPSSNRAFWDAQNTAVKAADPTNANASIGADGVYNAFWRHALTGDDQLRQRLAFALSQIFVISLADGNVGNQPRAVAQYLDLLGEKGTTTYRELLESVSLHPLMGTYLTSIRNRKADVRTGRVPDENYAREVMQLFAIGLVELNNDGSVKQVNGAPRDTYGPDDIAGLAKVFTGFSWACADLSNNCFNNGALGGVSDPERWTKPMVGYPQFHATEEKRFLGTTIPAQGTADPAASLKAGLDALANHPNVGPFIGRQLIQRLVTSNPSPAYVSAVAAAFNNNGSGVRGDMKAVLKAVLLHPEARQASDRSGKLREPILRLSTLLRAYGYASDSGRFRIGNTDAAGSSLGQTVMRSPSVFNFYRPGYVAPGTQAAAAGLVAPEMALAQETSAAGYVNYLRDGISQGFGASGPVTVNGAQVTRRDLQPDFTAELALADKPDELVQKVASKLMPGEGANGGMPELLKKEIVDAVGAIAVPQLNSSGSNQAQITNAKRNRVNAAVFLTMVSPEFQVQK
ncbi:DUF1800 domain-containing protein [Piscinibacter sp.]|uniref:DUF1800 domain-containing protein n=1 Tax=Piscinibacter sp. TaxID=1903157 RepID=UPI0039E4F3ED